MTIVEKAAYLKGLTEGLGMDPASRDGKLWGALTDLLGDIAHTLEEHQAGLDAHEETLDDVYEQLIYLQEIALPSEETDFDEEDFAFGEDEEDEDEDSLYPASLHLYEGEDEGDGDEDEEEEDGELEYDGVLYDVTCPGCGQTITFDEETLDKGSIQCPGCGEMLEFDLGGEDD